MSAARRLPPRNVQIGFLCWLGLHKWAWNKVGGSVGDQFCTRPFCLASRSKLSGRVYWRKSLFRR
jgi:hypothetical protein